MLNFILFLSVVTVWQWIVSPLFKKCLGNFGISLLVWEYVVVQLVEALRYEPDGCEFESRWSYCNFSVT